VANLGIPASMQRATDPIVADTGDEPVHMTRRELESRMEAIHKQGVEEGIARGRALALDEAREDVLVRGKALEEKSEAAQRLVEKLEAALREVADEADSVRARIDDAVNAVASKMALKLLFSLESSEDMLASVVANIVDDFHPRSIRIGVDPELVDRLAKRFAEDEAVEVLPGAEGKPLSVHFETEGGSFEYRTENAFEQLERMIEQRRGSRS
jgi:flagellar biosynthesis/type III secretory pathway protein FliH